MLTHRRRAQFKGFRFFKQLRSQISSIGATSFLRGKSPASDRIPRLQELAPSLALFALNLNPLQLESSKDGGTLVERR